MVHRQDPEPVLQGDRSRRRSRGEIWGRVGYMIMTREKRQCLLGEPFMSDYVLISAGICGRHRKEVHTTKGGGRMKSIVFFCIVSVLVMPLVPSALNFPGTSALAAAKRRSTRRRPPSKWAVPFLAPSVQHAAEII
jgi:hypothetical protein